MYSALVAFLCFSCSPGTKTGGDSPQLSDTASSIAFPYTAWNENWSISPVVVAQLKDEPRDLHPANNSSVIKDLFFHYLHRTLVAADPEKLSLRPSLLEAMPQSSDGINYTCTLRDSLRWDDGSPVTGQDVVFTFKAYLCPLVSNPQVKASLQNLKSIRALPDGRRLILQMSSPSILNEGITVGLPLLRKKLFDPDNILENYSFSDFRDTTRDYSRDGRLLGWATFFTGARFGRDPGSLSGLGDYRVAEWVPAQHIILERKKRAGGPERIVFRFIKDPHALLLEFRNQRLDASASLPTSVLDQLQKDSLFNANYHAASMQASWYTYIAFNTRPEEKKRPPLFVSPRVRRALALLTPADAILHSLNLGRTRRISGPVLPESRDYSAFPLLPHDILEARRLLGAEGWMDHDGDGIRERKENGKVTRLTAEFLYINSGTHAEIARILAEYFAKAGVQLVLKGLEPEALYEKARSHDFDLLMGVWNSGFLPGDFRELWHTSSWISHGSNFTGFGNASSDRLIDSISRLTTYESRHQPVKRLLETIYNEQPCIFLFQGSTRVVAHKRFGNVKAYRDKPYLCIDQWKPPMPNLP